MKMRRLRDELKRVDLSTAPPRRPEKPGRAEPDRAQEHVPAVPGLHIIRTGRGCYRVHWAGRSYDLCSARIEDRVGGRWRRNVIRWLIGYVGRVLHAFFMGIVREAPEWDGLHIWLDHFIRRAGLDFTAWWFRLLDLKLAQVG